MAIRGEVNTYISFGDRRAEVAMAQATPLPFAASHAGLARGRGAAYPWHHEREPRGPSAQTWSRLPLP